MGIGGATAHIAREGVKNAKLRINLGDGGVKAAYVSREGVKSVTPISIWVRRVQEGEGMSFSVSTIYVYIQVGWAR